MSEIPGVVKNRVLNLMSIDFVPWRQPDQSRRRVQPRTSGPAISKGSGGLAADVRVVLTLAALTAAVMVGPGCGGPKPQAASAGPSLQTKLFGQRVVRVASRIWQRIVEG